MSGQRFVAVGVERDADLIGASGQLRQVRPVAIDALNGFFVDV